jgi:hypothetical protein
VTDPISRSLDLLATIVEVHRKLGLVASNTRRVRAGFPRGVLSGESPAGGAEGSESSSVGDGIVCMDACCQLQHILHGYICYPIYVPITKAPVERCGPIKHLRHVGDAGNIPIGQIAVERPGHRKLYKAAEKFELQDKNDTCLHAIHLTIELMSSTFPVSHDETSLAKALASRNISCMNIALLVFQAERSASIE